MKTIGRSLLISLCRSMVSLLIAGWKYVCSASIINLTPFFSACFRKTTKTILKKNVTQLSVTHSNKFYVKGYPRVESLRILLYTIFERNVSPSYTFQMTLYPLSYHLWWQGQIKHFVYIVVVQFTNWSHLFRRDVW